MKIIMSSVKYFSAASLCFLIGVTSFYLAGMRLSESPKSTVTGDKNASVMQGKSVDADSSRFNETIMVDLQNSVSRTMAGYEFKRAFCTCPGIISGQQSYSYGNLERAGNFVADVYIAESRSSIAAKKWIARSLKVGSDQFLRAPGLEAVRSRNGNGRDLTILIRIDKVVIQISGEASAVEALGEGVLRQLPAS